MTKRAWMTSGLLIGTALLVTGCVPEQKYNDLLTSYKGQEQQLLTTQNELSTARANEDRLRTQIAATMADLEELQKRIANGDPDMEA
jgi:peptidoglycan hydrolase CwlO-like protein